MIPHRAWPAVEQTQAISSEGDEESAKKLWRTASTAGRASVSKGAQAPSADSTPGDISSIDDLLPKSFSMPMLPMWTSERATSPLPIHLRCERPTSSLGRATTAGIKPGGKMPMQKKEREHLFHEFVSQMAPPGSDAAQSTPPPGVEVRPHTSAGLYATSSLGTHTAANHQGVRAIGVRGPPNSGLSLYGGSSGGSSRVRVTLQGQPSMAKVVPPMPAHLAATRSARSSEEVDRDGEDVTAGSIPLEAMGGKEVRASPGPFADALTPLATRHDALALRAWLLGTLSDLGIVIPEGNATGMSSTRGTGGSRPSSRMGLDGDRPASPALRAEMSSWDMKDGTYGGASSNGALPFHPGPSVFDDGQMEEEDVDILTQAFKALNVAETEMERQVATHSEERRQVMHHAWAMAWLIFHCLSCDKRFLDTLLHQKEEEFTTAKNKILHEVLSKEKVIVHVLTQETEAYKQKNKEYQAEADRLKLRMKQARELLVMKRELMELDSHLQDDLQGVTLDLTTTEKELDNDRRRIKDASADINDQVAQYMELLSELDRTKAEHRRLTEERELLRARLRKEGVSLAVPTLGLETTMGRLGHVAMKAAATAASQIKARQASAGKGRLSTSGDPWDERVRRLSKQEEDDPMVTIELCAGTKSMRLSEVPMTPRPVFTSKLESRSTIAKVRELQRKVIDARVTYRHLQDKAVQMEKSRKRRAEEQQIRQWQSTLEREAPQIADEASGQAKRFTPLGCDEEIPNFLRSSDPVKNRAYRVDEVQELVVEIWREKLDHDKKTGSRTSLFRAADHYLRRKLHIQCNIVEAGYSLVAGMLLYQECHDADLFYHTMIGVVDECVFLDLHHATETFRDRVIAMDRNNNFGEGTGLVLSEEVQAVLVQSVPYLDDTRMKRLLDVLEPVTNEEGWINYAEVFNAQLQKGSFSNMLRIELLADRYRFLGMLKVRAPAAPTLRMPSARCPVPWATTSGHITANPAASSLVLGRSKVFWLVYC
eukprot:jgi/Mesvir1/16204/Mv08465-RA.2